VVYRQGFQIPQEFFYAQLLTATPISSNRLPGPIRHPQKGYESMRLNLNDFGAVIFLLDIPKFCS
jgi:hypothetical protein